ILLGCMKKNFPCIAIGCKSMPMRKFLFILLISSVLTSCEKGITFDLDDPEPKLVVEATIENGQPPVVILSKSLNFFSRIDASMLTNSFVHNAEVYVSNGIVSHRLKEYSNPVGSGVFFYYSIDTSNLSTAFVGQLNRQYSLRVVS